MHVVGKFQSSFPEVQEFGDQKRLRKNFFPIRGRMPCDGFESFQIIEKVNRLRYNRLTFLAPHHPPTHPQGSVVSFQ